MAATTDATLFEEDFVLTTIDNAKYDRVMRIYGYSEDNSISLALDVNLELFPCAVGDRVTVVLASTLQLDGTKEDKGWRDVSSGEHPTLADMFEYVCYGKIYKFEDGKAGQV
jgi:DNA-directed RNA polymerase I, II, and III subunit RPABC3